MSAPDFLEGRVPGPTGVGLATGSLLVAETLQLAACTPSAVPVRETQTNPANLELTQAIASQATDVWRQANIPLEAGHVGRIDGPIEFMADPTDTTGQKLRILTALKPDGTLLDPNLQYGMATAVVQDTTTGERLGLAMLVQFSKATNQVEAWGLFENQGPSVSATHGEFTVNVVRGDTVKPTTLTVTTDVVKDGIMVEAHEAGGATYLLVEASGTKPTTTPTESPTAVPASPWVDLLVDVLSGAKTVEAAPLEPPATATPTNLPPTEAPPTNVPTPEAPTPVPTNTAVTPEAISQTELERLANQLICRASNCVSEVTIHSEKRGNVEILSSGQIKTIEINNSQTNELIANADVVVGVTKDSTGKPKVVYIPVQLWTASRPDINLFPWIANYLSGNFNDINNPTMRSRQELEIIFSQEKYFGFDFPININKVAQGQPWTEIERKVYSDPLYAALIKQFVEFKGETSSDEPLIIFPSGVGQ